MPFLPSGNLTHKGGRMGILLSCYAQPQPSSYRSRCAMLKFSPKNRPAEPVFYARRTCFVPFGGCSATPPLGNDARPARGSLELQNEVESSTKSCYSERARRSPRSSSLRTGAGWIRRDDRQPLASKNQLPPRHTRLDPLEGPLGSVWATLL